jgi:uncharacterized damage-inducible protein DinB
MESISTYCKEQYELVRESRMVLFAYCRTVSPDDFIRSNSAFGRGGSIRNLLVHIANTYEFWIGKLALRKDIVFSEYEASNSIGEVVNLFGFVDGIIYEVMDDLDNKAEIEYEIGGLINRTKLFKIFTHVITHEFHHKGQILSISRSLGYIPVDTDILR